MKQYFANELPLNHEHSLNYWACSLADYDATLDAYQYLVDTGAIWQLQGSFGRIAQHLIDAGLIKCN